MAVEGPIRPVTVRMPEALHARITPGASARVESALDLLLGDIALAGRTAVELVPGPRFEVQADGGVCGCPDVLVAQARAYVTGSDAVSEEDLTGLEPAASDELLELVCGAVLSEHPRMLGLSHELPSPGAIDLLVEPAYLRELSCISGIAESFLFMRDGLFVELGLPVPPIRLVPDDSLRPNGFALRIGHKRAIPWIGLDADTLLVNDTADRLGLMVPDAERREARNPSTRQPAALVRGAGAELLEGAGLTTWDRVGYLILTLADGVRQNAHFLLTPEILSGIVRRLEMAFPAAVEGFGDQFDVALTTLRALLEDEVSIRGMYQIAELLQHHEALQEEVPGMDVLPAVRHGLADAIGHKFTRGTGTLVVYIIDPALERDVTVASADPRWPYTDLAAELGEIHATELAFLPGVAQKPVLLTHDSIRVAVRSALRVRHPQTAVLGYNDVPVDCNVQPVARLSRS